MKYCANIAYPNFEVGKVKELDDLFQLWHKEAKGNKLPEGYCAEDLVFDGFYPYYTEQRRRVLFIGREARGLSGYNYLDALFSAYKEKNIGGTHINSSLFHRRMFY